MNLNEKTAIVTGAADGIGKASALAFAEHGADVVLADIDGAKNERAAAEVAAATGRKTLAVTCDVTRQGDLENLFASAVDRFGQCDILLNNAGIVFAGDILDLDPADFDRVLAVNLRSCFVLTQLVARHMVAKGIEGAIINMASLNSNLAIPSAAGLHHVQRGTAAIDPGKRPATGGAQHSRQRHRARFDTHQRAECRDDRRRHETDHSLAHAPAPAGGNRQRWRKLPSFWPATIRPTLPGRPSFPMAAGRP